MNNLEIAVELKSALKELVDLKKIKDESENLAPLKREEMLKDYRRRKPAAWARARRLVHKYKLLGVRA